MTVRRGVQYPEKAAQQNEPYLGSHSEVCYWVRDASVPTGVGVPQLCVCTPQVPLRAQDFLVAIAYDHAGHCPLRLSNHRVPVDAIFSSSRVLAVRSYSCRNRAVKSSM